MQPVGLCSLEIAFITHTVSVNGVQRDKGREIDNGRKEGRKIKMGKDNKSEREGERRGKEQDPQREAAVPECTRPCREDQSHQVLRHTPRDLHDHL